ncbi:DUF262 domain-containing protein [Allocoleopsis franciscana]|uniref:GmrSD restriction endonucleases N-terminal domain-containing protein n=1 Tax=Allocoleopsis franciscana PCC 7113 TaxID=1173027 RepID=K9WJB3_9CYAN|nr:DUF262 domain-containing protein [Allocoleopsis franciscana]AFZ19906.1 Protein of unknown function DUF262 [Allocoleopsis franciscana PCC 7113]
MKSLEDIIDDKIGEVRTESLDLTFGEIVNLHATRELVIQPEYQRLFRWSDDQKSRLIESILLELPIPQIFVIERETGVFELIDGLQRVSSVIQFINPAVLDLDPLVLQGCDLVTELNDKKFDDLSLRLRLTIKRSSVRTVVIKRQSRFFLRYTMFKRLNTGGVSLDPQEIRNCSARMVGEDGTRFYSFLQNKATHPAFLNCIESLAQVEKDKKGDEELVLRFLATKNARHLFKESVRDWLDNYMEKILLKDIEFDYEKEEITFNKVFIYLSNALGEGSFVKYRGDKPIGGLAPAYYEAITIGTLNAIDEIINLPIELVRKKVIATVQTDDFRQNTGPGANKRSKLEGRIKVIQDALLELTNE